mgnify:CR=1 FL=1
MDLSVLYPRIDVKLTATVQTYTPLSISDRQLNCMFDRAALFFDTGWTGGYEDEQATSPSSDGSCWRSRTCWVWGRDTNIHSDDNAVSNADSEITAGADRKPDSTGGRVNSGKKSVTDTETADRGSPTDGSVYPD